MFETQKLASPLTGGLPPTFRGTPLGVLAGWSIVFFPVLCVFCCFAVCACLAWPLAFDLLCCACVFAFAVWLLVVDLVVLWLGLVSCPVFDACGRFVLAVTSVAAAMLWSCPALSVVGVAEVPLVCCGDRLSAFGASVCLACG